MFFNAPGNPSQLKKAIYLSASTILGVLLSFIVHAFIEIRYLRWAESHGRSVIFYGGCALPPALRIALLLLGIVGGFLLGRFWWRKVYIERVWAKKYSAGKNIKT
jgi:hypothetical protein